MKILIFSPYYFPCIEGLSLHVDSLARELVKKGGYEITIVTPRLHKEAAQDEMANENMRVLRFPAFFLVSNFALPKFWKRDFWVCVRKICEIEKADIVMSHMRFFPISLGAYLYSKLAKSKWIHIEHGSSFVELSSKTKTKIAFIYDKLIGRFVLHRSVLNIGDSNAVRDFINAHFDRRTVVVIQNSVNFQKIDKIEKDALLEEKFREKKVVTFVGRLVKWKGAAEAIRAFKNLPEEKKKLAILIIIGDGEDKNKINKMALEEKNILIMGELSHEKMLGILKITDVYIHPVFPGGGLSTSLLEAMSMGCSVLSTPHEGALDVIVNEKNGILVDTYEQMGLQLLRLVNDETLRKSIGNNAKETVRNHFSWEAAARQYEKIFEQVLTAGN